MRLEKWFISNLDDSQRNIIVQSIDKSIAVRGAAGRKRGVYEGLPALVCPGAGGGRAGAGGCCGVRA